MAEDEIKKFKRIVWEHYKKYGRHDLPWRKIRNPYKILVSEVMLQQTQVERVIQFYKTFIKKFPTAKKLATAPLSEVLKSWQGLGYNRRAKMLHQTAKELAKTRVPLATKGTLVTDLEKLSGVGPYTANAIKAFAYNQDVIVIETNIRTAVIHYFFSNYGHRKSIDDTEIAKILKEALPKGRAREWYSALMDYGAYLKKSGIKLNTKHAKYVKQKKFAGSLREARGAILRVLSSQGDSSLRGVTLRNVLNLFGPSRRMQLRAALAALQKEGLIEKKGNKYRLAD